MENFAFLTEIFLSLPGFEWCIKENWKLEFFKTTTKSINFHINFLFFRNKWVIQQKNIFVFHFLMIKISTYCFSEIMLEDKLMQQLEHIFSLCFNQDLCRSCFLSEFLYVDLNQNLIGFGTCFLGILLTIFYFIF